MEGQAQILSKEAVMLACSGDIDLCTYSKLEQEVYEKGKVGQIYCIDLQQVKYIDSEGVKAIIRIMHWAEERESKVMILAEGSCLRHLKLAGLNHTVPLYQPS